jgi:hypothetical protein
VPEPPFPFPTITPERAPVPFSPSTFWAVCTRITYGLCRKKKGLAGGSSVCYNAPDLAGGGTLQIVLVFVFVVAVAFGAWFFGYGLSIVRDQSSETDLEPQVPDAQRDAA